MLRWVWYGKSCDRISEGRLFWSSWFLLTPVVVQQNSNYPDAGYPELQLSGSLGLSGKFVENSTKLNRLQITGYLIKCSTVLWLIELQIGRGRKV